MHIERFLESESTLLTEDSVLTKNFYDDGDLGNIEYFDDEAETALAFSNENEESEYYSSIEESTPLIINSETDLVEFPDSILGNNVNNIIVDKIGDDKHTQVDQPVFDSFQIPFDLIAQYDKIEVESEILRAELGLFAQYDDSKRFFDVAYFALAESRSKCYPDIMSLCLKSSTISKSTSDYSGSSVEIDEGLEDDVYIDEVNAGSSNYPQYSDNYRKIARIFFLENNFNILSVVRSYLFGVRTTPSSTMTNPATSTAPFYSTELKSDYHTPRTSPSSEGDNREYYSLMETGVPLGWSNEYDTCLYDHWNELSDSCRLAALELKMLRDKIARTKLSREVSVPLFSSPAYLSKVLSAMEVFSPVMMTLVVTFSALMIFITCWIYFTLFKLMQIITYHHSGTKKGKLVVEVFRASCTDVESQQRLVPLDSTTNEASVRHPLHLIHTTAVGSCYRDLGHHHRRSHAGELSALILDYNYTSVLFRLCCLLLALLAVAVFSNYSVAPKSW